MNVSVFYDRKLLKRLEQSIGLWDRSDRLEDIMERWQKDYWMERDVIDKTDTRPVSCKLVCSYGTYDGRPCLKDPLNCIDIYHDGRWHCVLRTYGNGTRTIQVLPL